MNFFDYLQYYEFGLGLNKDFCYYFFIIEKKNNNNSIN